MNVLRWIIENWDNIVAAVALVLVTIMTGRRFIKNWKTLTNDERVAYAKRLLENLMPIAIKLVSSVESKYGDGTGALKRAEVIDELYSRIPDAYKPYVTEKNLEAILEDALDKARVLWEDNYSINKLVIQRK